MKLPRLSMSAAEEVRLLEKLRGWGTAPIPVPPQDDALRNSSILTLRTAILEGQKQRRDARIRRQLGRGLAGLAGLAAIVAFALWLPPPGNSSTSELAAVPSSPAAAPSVAEERHAQLTGTGTLKGPGGRAEAVKEGVALYPGERVRAGDGGAQVHTQTTRVIVEPNAVVALTELTPLAEEWTLDRGTARFSVDPERRKHVTVITGDTRVEVVGTEFAVATEGSPESRADEHASTAVSVQKGRVTVRHEGLVYVLGPGDSWESTPKARPLPSTAPREASRTTIPRDTKENKSSKTNKVRSADTSTTLALENRLFHEALILRNSGHNAEASRAFAGFIARFPSSALRADAERELTRLRLSH